MEINKIKKGFYVVSGKTKVLEIIKTCKPLNGMKWATFDKRTGDLLAKHKTLNDAFEIAKKEA
jgi:hypothetical protein